METGLPKKKEVDVDSAACRRSVSDADQSVRCSYSATAEREPAMVKEEPEWGEYGASEAAVAEGLYANHEIKYEIEIGPELIQQQDVALSIPNTLNRMAVAPCKLKPAGGAGAAPECTPTRPGEVPRCNTSHEQQFELRGCSVRLERSLMEHTPTCSTCLEIFPCKSSLQEHSCTHPLEESKTGEELATHRLETGSERLLQYLSDTRILTEETSFSKNLSKSHCQNQSIVSSAKDGKPFLCDICKSRFALKKYLARHMRIHTGQKPFSCNICNSRFAWKRQLTDHIRTHTGEKPFSCDFCKLWFSHRSNLITHKRTHTGEKPYSCDICTSRFSQKSSLTVHKRIHTGEKPYVCNVCKSRFTDRSALAAHRRTHTGVKPFSCDYCKSRFSLKSTLESHTRTHTGEKPFSCDICKSQFTQRNQLTVHRRTHTGEKRFSCDICTSRFSRKDTLDAHKRTHSGGKPFSCGICKSRFTQKHNLARHERTHTVPGN